MPVLTHDVALGFLEAYGNVADVTTMSELHLVDGERATMATNTTPQTGTVAVRSPSGEAQSPAAGEE